MKKARRVMLRLMKSVVVIVGIGACNVLLAQTNPTADITLEMTDPPSPTSAGETNTVGYRFTNNGPEAGSVLFDADLGPRNDVPFRIIRDSSTGGCGAGGVFLDAQGFPYFVTVASPILEVGESVDCTFDFVAANELFVRRYEFDWVRAALGINDPNPNNDAATFSFVFLIPANAIPSLSLAGRAALIMGLIVCAFVLLRRS